MFTTFRLFVVVFAFYQAAVVVEAASFVKCEGVDGESKATDQNGEFWFTDLHPDVRLYNDRRIPCGLQAKGPRGKESGEKGGTEDINIGIGELNFTKPMDKFLSPRLTESWNRILSDKCWVCHMVDPLVPPTGTEEITFNTQDDCFLLVEMDRCIVTSYSVMANNAGSLPVENVRINFAKVQFHYNTGTGPNFDEQECVIWDIKDARCRRGGI